jgi:hypothetical protein
MQLMSHGMETESPYMNTLVKNVGAGQCSKGNTRAKREQQRGRGAQAAMQNTRAIYVKESSKFNKISNVYYLLIGSKLACSKLGISNDRANMYGGMSNKIKIDGADMQTQDLCMHHTGKIGTYIYDDNLDTYPPRGRCPVAAAELKGAILYLGTF